MLKQYLAITASPLVQRFLDSISRNSIKSMRSYSSGLTHFRKFLSYDDVGKYRKYNIETILKDLSNNKINVYELLDDYVSFLISRQGISPKSMSLYLAALRSYFAYYDIDVIPSKFRRKMRYLSWTEKTNLQ